MRDHGWKIRKFDMKAKEKKRNDEISRINATFFGRRWRIFFDSTTWIEKVWIIWWSNVIVFYMYKEYVESEILYEIVEV